MELEKKALTTADRQKLYKERQREAGYRQTTVWIHTNTEEEGKQAARDGKPLKPMESKDPLSWAAGWISEKGKQ
ncbi:hypothetical protein [Pseudomonas extremorientalis]|uniref:Uncharacterized protein n=1 Tax=Pseudomonas extremorientalis TaxID=169669 RepID=A0A1H0P984_9PSED|nr:hypothetical protein [Pseudomonas extremorientalis]KAB0521801.1 hypothetical protein F7R08_01120 [Pseudomonas extremorientalis]OIN07849.1 hypothetical protein BFN10_16280 [Pseudomonas extremorientalis]SDP01248.1 hypothetical protein SAMN04490184_2043 [Pseudomonas extremorientalis]